MTVSREHVTVPSGRITLEGELLNAKGKGAPAVALAPHPLYGGTMDNNVIDGAALALAGRGHPVLKINYRGVGRSGGTWSDGAGEADDAVAAAVFVGRGAGPGVVLCGYSFGAWVAIQAAARIGDVGPLLLISPPTTMLDCSALRTMKRFHAFCGDRDEFCDHAVLKTLAGDRLTVIPSANHFDTGTLGTLIKAIDTQGL